MSCRRAITILIMLFALVVGAIPLPSTAQQSQPVMYQESRRLMWTQFEIVAYGEDRTRLAEVAEAAFEEIDRLDRQMSNYSETSELTYIKRNAARPRVIVDRGWRVFLELSVGYTVADEGG